MADIPSSRVKINDIEVSADAPVTEALFNKIGADINDYLDKGLQYQEFLANGTWTCPDNVNWVILHGCGGGGGGAGGSNNQADDYSPNDINAPGGGGAGASIKTITVPVTPGNIYTINIGAGGAGGAAGTGIIGYGGPGGTGGDTTFVGADANIIMRGAPGGTVGINTYVPSASSNLNSPIGAPGRAAISMDGGTNGGGFTWLFMGVISAGSSIYASGGSNGAGTSGGGGASFGAGANGGADAANGSSAAANSGAGGGGGGTGPGFGVGTAGGAGGSGRLKIFWYGNA